MICTPHKIFSLVGILLHLSLQSAVWAQAGLPAAPGGAPAAPADEATYRQQVSFLLGQNVGRDLKQNEIPCDMQSFMAGVQSGFAGTPGKWSDAELQACRSRFEQEMTEKMMGRMQQVAGKNQQEAQAFLAKNAQVAGVQTTPSGLQYKVLKQGSGATPGATDRVSVHYRGTLLNGTEFDSSYGGEPASFGVSDRLIPAWTEALQKMKVGEKWQLFVPPDLAYGPNPPGPPIEPNSMLVFEIELLGIDGK